MFVLYDKQKIKHSCKSIQTITYTLFGRSAQLLFPGHALRTSTFHCPCFSMIDHPAQQHPQYCCVNLVNSLPTFCNRDFRPSPPSSNLPLLLILFPQAYTILTHLSLESWQSSLPRNSPGKEMSSVSNLLPSHPRQPCVLHLHHSRQGHGRKGWSFHLK